MGDRPIFLKTSAPYSSMTTWRPIELTYMYYVGIVAEAYVVTKREPVKYCTVYLN